MRAFIVLGGLLLAVAARADTIEDTVFTMHLKAVTSVSASACSTWSPVPPDITTWSAHPPVSCSNFVTGGDLFTNYYAYLVIARTNPDGIAGVSCGVQYGAGLQASWTRCSDLEFPSGGWPVSGSGNRITWAPQTNCQKTAVPGSGVQVVAGYFSLYAASPELFRITQNHQVPVPELVVADCSATETELGYDAISGWLVFTAGAVIPGCNPCWIPCHPGAVESSTWGKIKAKYGTTP